MPNEFATFIDYMRGTPPEPPIPWDITRPLRPCRFCGNTKPAMSVVGGDRTGLTVMMRPIYVIKCGAEGCLLPTITNVDPRKLYRWWNQVPIDWREGMAEYD